MKNKLTRNNKLVTILLHLRRFKMECPTKSMSSYQRLKWEMDELYKDYRKLKDLVNEIDNHLWEANKTATGETREHIQRAMRAIHMYEKK